MTSKRICITTSCQKGNVRPNNEDAISIDGKLIRDDSYNTIIEIGNSDRDIHLCAVADGMGGYEGGEVASMNTLDSLSFFIKDLPAGLDVVQLKEHINVWLNSINSTINKMGRYNMSLKNMGTTLVAVIFYYGRCYWFNAGDSRLYLHKKDKLVQITLDHTLATVRNSKKHNNIPTNCIGAGNENAYIDFGDITDDIDNDTTLLLCSDGLNDMLTDDQIEMVIRQEGRAKDLTHLATVEGGIDNVSTCMIKLETYNNEETDNKEEE